jgi:hypothetical protein
VLIDVVEVDDGEIIRLVERYIIPKKKVAQGAVGAK